MPLPSAAFAVITTVLPAPAFFVVTTPFVSTVAYLVLLLLQTIDLLVASVLTLAFKSIVFPALTLVDGALILTDCTNTSFDFAAVVGGSMVVGGCFVVV